MINLQDVSTSYGRVPMLEKVSMTVAVGELVTLLGSNGAGKTTTFRTITGIVRPLHGQVQIAGIDIGHKPISAISRIGLGVVPEGRRLFPQLTVEENLKLGFSLNARNRSFETALEPIAARFPRVKERLKQHAGTLSGGEQAMVALARALISEPKYIIMDEPSLGLSPNLVDEYFAFIEALKGPGRAILLIEQNVAQSVAISDRTYILRKGKIVFSGASAELADSDMVSSMYLGMR